VCDLETSRMGAPYIYIYDISHLRVKQFKWPRPQCVKRSFTLALNPPRSCHIIAISITGYTTYLFIKSFNLNYCLQYGVYMHRVLVGKPEGKRPLGRPRRRWEDNIKMDLQEVGLGRGDWIESAQDRDRWRALVGMVRDFRVP